MKKISLRGISEILSEKELKNVMGGCDDGGCHSIPGVYGVCFGDQLCVKGEWLGRCEYRGDGCKCV